MGCGSFKTLDSMSRGVSWKMDKPRVWLGLYVPLEGVVPDLISWHNTAWGGPSHLASLRAEAGVALLLPARALAWSWCFLHMPLRMACLVQPRLEHSFFLAPCAMHRPP